MHVVHCANFYGPDSGGIRTAVDALAAGYRGAGHRLTLVVPGKRPGVRVTPWGMRITVPSVAVPASGGYRVVAQPRVVADLVGRLAPDRLEVSDRTTLHGLGAWGRRHEVPTVMFAHERIDGVLRAHFGVPQALARGLADLRNRRSAATFDTVVVTSDYAAVEFGRIGAGHLAHVPLGVDLVTFDPARHDPALRAELAAGAEVLLVICSRLSTEKRPELAVEALKWLQAWGVRARLVVVGSGPRQAVMRRVAGTAPVTFAGFISDRARLAGVLAAADVVIAPGPIETFGLAALEALASGTPVVSADSGAVGEVVGPAGQVAAAEGRALARAVCEVLARPVAARRAAARHRAEAYSWDRTVAAMLAVHGA